MDFDDFLYSRLAGAVGDLVGGTTGDFGSDFGSDFSHDDIVDSRIYPVVSEEDPSSAPVVVYTIADEERITTLAGPTGLTRYTWGAKIASKEYDTGKAIESGLKDAFHAVAAGQMRMSKHTGTQHEAEEEPTLFVRTLTFETHFQEDA